MVTSRLARPTDLVFPLETGPEPDPVAEAEAAATELDWSYNDAELTMQLKAVHAGRGRILMMIAASMLAVSTAVALVL
jgi:hypothetical protein